MISIFAATVRADEIVVNFSTATLEYIRNGQVLFSTSVVLPARDYYPVPIAGTVERASMGPTWVPTRNMHRDHPGRYRRSYGPYQAGNAMGHCKLEIDFGGAEAQHPILRTVRIHGAAKPEDLGARLSRSCIRIPDAVCPTLVEATNAATSLVQVSFTYTH